MNRADRAYYRRRAAREWRASRKTLCLAAARVHQRLAIEYEDRLRSAYSGLLSIHEDRAVRSGEGR